MASQPARSRSLNRPGAPSVPRPRVARSLDLDEPQGIPPAFLEKADPAQVLASLEQQVEKIRAGRARGTDGDEILREIDEYIATLER